MAALCAHLGIPLERAVAFGDERNDCSMLAAAGLGVAIAPELLVANDLTQGRLVAPWPALETNAALGLWLAPGRERRRGEHLAAWLVRELAAG